MFLWDLSSFAFILCLAWLGLQPVFRVLFLSSDFHYPFYSVFYHHSFSSCLSYHPFANPASPHVHATHARSLHDIPLLILSYIFTPGFMPYSPPLFLSLYTTIIPTNVPRCMFYSPHLSKFHVYSFPSLRSTPSMPIARHYLHLQAFVFSFQNTHHAYLHTSHAHSFLTIPSPPLDAHSRPRMVALNLPRTLPQSRRLPFHRSTHRRSPPACQGGCGCCCCCRRHHPPICCHFPASSKWRRLQCPSPRRCHRRWGSEDDEREA